jgi:L-threonylcarbamoyladenylate synthase
MLRLVVDRQVPDAAMLATAADVLRSGGVVAYPTDTLYGLAVDPRSDEAVARLFDLKGRDAASAIALIAADARTAAQAGTFGAIERQLAAAFWPGPLTIVIRATGNMAAALSPAGTIGVRVPAHAVARQLSSAFGECITATSANRTGARPCVTADEVAEALAENVDLVIDGGPSPGGAPSTIVEVIGGRVTLHRAGAVPWERVLESVG